MKRTICKLYFGIFLLSIFFVGCKKDSVTTELYPDSYIRSINNRAGIPVYAVMHTAYSFSPMSSVKVTGTSGKSTDLTNYGDGGYSFYSTIDSAAYTLAVPSPETFTFLATYNNGQTLQGKNSIIAKSLLPAKGVVATKTATDIELVWKPVADVSAYKIRIYSAGSVIYESDFLIPNDFTVDLKGVFSLTSFSQYLSSELTIEISAFSFETGKDTFNAVSVTSLKQYFGN